MFVYFGSSRVVIIMYRAVLHYTILFVMLINVKITTPEPARGGFIDDEINKQRGGHFRSRNRGQFCQV